MDHAAAVAYPLAVGQGQAGVQMTAVRTPPARREPTNGKPFQPGPRRKRPLFCRRVLRAGLTVVGVSAHTFGLGFRHVFAALRLPVVLVADAVIYL
jgi:hypothetical protein